MENNSRYLRLELNQPTIISLRFIPGKNVTDGWNKPQILWITGDGRALYTPPVVAEQLKELGIKPGQRFMLVKATKQGSKGVEWSVSKLDAGASSSERPAPIPAGSVGSAHWPKQASIASQPGTSSDPDGASVDPQSKPIDSAPMRNAAVPSASGSPAGRLSGTGQSPVKRMNQPGQPSSPPVPLRGRVPGGHETNQSTGQPAIQLLTKTSLEPAYLDDSRPATEATRKPSTLSTSRLAAALKTAVSAAHEAEKHAENLGYACRFTPSDIRALGITAFIQGGAGGRNAA